MRDNPKVVLFDRSAAWLHHRAMMNRRDNHIIDALELMRGAVEASPDNCEYRLDLAELYCQMGCHAQSSRLLLDILSEADAPSECYYGLALNQLGMNDVQGARQSLAMYRRESPTGDHSEEVSQLADELAYYRDMNRPDSRRLYRAMCLANRGCDAMKSDVPDKACRLFRRSLRLSGEQFEMRALYAMALLMSGNRAAARREASRAAMGSPPSVKALCVCAQVFAMLEDRPRALQLMDRAAAEHPSGQELRLMIYAAGELKLHDRAAEYARLAMQETPFDRELMHIRAVASYRAGAGVDEAARCWERILRIDPEDSVALFYQAAAAHGALDDYPLDYAYQVPEAEYIRRLKVLSENLIQGFDHVRALWDADPAFRALVRWAIYEDDTRLGRASMTVLATMESPEARSVLRQLMFAPDVARELKVHAALLLKMQGREIADLLPRPAALLGDALVDSDALMAAMSVGDRQLVRYADEVLSREYDVSARPALAMMWTAYRAGRGTRGDPLKRVQAASAALAYYYLLSSGSRPAIGKLARMFGCTARQMVYCARRIAACLEQSGGNYVKQEEDTP